MLAQIIKPIRLAPADTVQPTRGAKAQVAKLLRPCDILRPISQSRHQSPRLQPHLRHSSKTAPGQRLEIPAPGARFAAGRGSAQAVARGPMQEKMMHKVMKPDAEWLAELGELAFQVTRRAATERPFSHPGFPKGPGTYRCVCCDAPLFDASTKFESGCGWPSFNAALPNDMVEEHEDRTHYMVRTEVTCSRCDAHLGHVFPDGPPPTGLRYCINGVAVRFDPED
jgi:peptide-methionine (R)-S-oxide reductase